MVIIAIKIFAFIVAVWIARIIYYGILCLSEYRDHIGGYKG